MSRRLAGGRRGRILAGLVLLGLGVSGGAPAWAGGGASRTLVVVNEDSPTSLRVGTAYAALRGIPSHQICRLSRVPHRQLTTIALLRERILAPIEAFLTSTGLDATIDTVAFSIDFPFAATYAADVPDAEKGPVPPHIALNGALYLARRVLAGDAGYADLDVNRYGRVGPGGPLDSVGFRSTYLYERSGDVQRSPTPEALAEAPDRYRLATLLGWHGLQGQSVPDLLAGLARSAAADGTHPEGTVYLMDHPDIRARTRKPFFEQTVEALAARGRKAVVLVKGEGGEDGVLPQGHDDVVGLVAGIAGFQWAGSGSTMQPGALAEHLTSFGGRLDGSGQTKLTAFLAAGAAGSSGTVCEPLAIWQKFPAPFLHVHYADGCSLAEAYYQSVMGPYQLLIVGDPLTRPFAHLRAVTSADVASQHPWKGTVEVRVEVGAGQGEDPAVLELYVDGRQVAAGPAGAALTVDSTVLEDGGHEVRLAAVVADAVETRSEWGARIEVDNGGPTPTLVVPRKPVTLDEDVALSGKAPAGVKEVEVRQGHAVLVRVPVRSGRWKTSLPAARLGQGTVPLYVRAVDADGRGARSALADVVVEAPAPLGSRRRTRRKAKGGEATADGLAVTVVTAKGRTDDLVVQQFPLAGAERLAARLAKALDGEVQSITCEGVVVVPSDGVYQWALSGPGTITLRLHDEVVWEGTLEGTDAGYAETSLPAGAHPLSITLVPAGPPALSILLGGDIVPQVLGGALLKH